MSDYSKLIVENSKSLKVLYVEDDAELRENTIELLSLYFDSLDYAEDGQQGLDKYVNFEKETGSTYDIVISDIQMPNMNGIEMSEEIKKINPTQIIVFITAFNDTDYLLKAISLGADSYISKPLDLENFKKSLYRVTQRANEDLLVKKYYDEIENKAVALVDHKDATGYESSKDIYSDLEANKEEISKIWTATPIVHERLGKHQIDVEFFRTHYAIKIVEYFLKVINDEAEMGNCPVVFTMLEFFKNKHLPLEDIFMVCVTFKNTVTEFVLQRYTFNHDVFIDISTILDRNFEGVVMRYLSSNYTINNDLETQPQVKETQKREEKPQEAKEHINYTEYVLDHDLYVLEDLEEDIDNTAIAVSESEDTAKEDFVHLGEQIKKYGKVLANYPLFSRLGASIIKLGIEFSLNAQVLHEEKERMLNIASLLEGFVNDLMIWRREIFKNNIDDPHFLDSSVSSNVDTIIMFINYDESSEAVEENLDDMFFI